MAYKVFSISGDDCYKLNLNSGFPCNILIDSTGNTRYISPLGQRDNFTGILYPLISKNL